MMIVLLSDFGDDYYVGVMKGVIHSVNKNSLIADLMHRLQPQNIRQGAWILLQSFSYFPKNTIFLAIVDPGVGGDRNAITIETRNYIFVGPDNGILYPAAKKDAIIEIRKIPIGKKSSKTFHGRDVFAKIAAQLDKGIKPRELGEKISSLTELSLLADKRSGEVMHIDTFGNIISNLKPLTKEKYRVHIKYKDIDLPFFETYESAPQNTLFLITGSANTLEISLKKGSAGSILEVNIGDSIDIS